MIGDAYRIKYSDYVLNIDGTDNGRFIEIEVTDQTNRPGVNTTNLNHSNPVKRVPLDVVLYGHRSRGYGAPLWNNLFYLLENFAQPSESTYIFPKYTKNAIPGQIWVDTSFEPAVPRWYGHNNTFYKLGASVNIAATASQAVPGELWFDTSTYTFRSYDASWSDISCIPYASQREYNTLAAATNALTTIPGTLPILTGSTKPTPTHWASLITNVRLLAQTNGVLAPSSIVDVLAADNFTICNAGMYGVATIKSTFLQIQASIDAINAALYPPTRLPLAGFIVSATTGTLPMVVNFTDTSTQTTVSSRDAFGPTRYTWDFGDGTTSTTPGNVSHTYTTAGSRVVTLTLVNSVGTTSAQGGISAAGLPVAQFLVGPDSNPDVSVTTPFTLAFTDQSTGSPTSWLWNFGDGTTSSDRNPAHTYTTMGDFTVSLLVTNAAGSNTATVTHAVQVGEPTIANFSYTTPTRNTADTSPFSVTFTDTSSNSPTSWLWNFGDGTTSTQQNPTHSYANWGRYTVSLTATNVLSNTALDVGNTSVKTMVDLVQVGLAPTSSFTLSSGVGTLPITIVATDTSANNPTLWQWDFGDGTGATSPNTAHVYTTYGTRTITLTTYNTIGTQTSSQAVTITPPAVVTSFSHTTSGSTVPVTVTYTDTSSNSPTSWLWNFGDGTTSTQQNPTHTYTTSGTYTTTLTAVNFAGGNSNSTTVTANPATFAANVVISADEQNVNIQTKLIAAGWDGVLPVVGSISIDSGVVVSANSTTQYALRTGGPYPVGSNLSIINNGYIVGMGGAGGTGQMREFVSAPKGGLTANVIVAAANGLPGGPALGLDPGGACSLYNYGVIAGGGGGGGGAASDQITANIVNHVGTFITGGQTTSPGGGGGQTGRTNSDGGGGGYGSYPGTFSGPGAALGPANHGDSGAGGSWGSAGALGYRYGSYSSVATSGGAGGAAVVGANGFILPLGTWGTYYGVIA